jgi:hypothetical protein
MADGQAPLGSQLDAAECDRPAVVDNPLVEYAKARGFNEEAPER